MAWSLQRVLRALTLRHPQWWLNVWWCDRLPLVSGVWQFDGSSDILLHRWSRFIHLTTPKLYINNKWPEILMTTKALASSRYISHVLWTTMTVVCSSHVITTNVFSQAPNTRLPWCQQGQILPCVHSVVTMFIQPTATCLLLGLESPLTLFTGGLAA